jgi:hypothetical protein
LFLQAEADGSNEFNNFQPGSINTTYQIISNLENIDMVVHIGDICYANGYLSQWDQFTAQIEPIASTVPYMIGRSAECSSSILSYVPLTYSYILLTRRGIFAVVTSGGSRMNTKEGLNSENLGLKLEINGDLRLMNTYLMKKLGL